MFTGIVESIGRVSAVTELGDSQRLTLTAPDLLHDAHHGDSICVNGVCLTVVEYDESTFTADVMQVTLDYSALGQLTVGSPVNLERAMGTSTRFGGHVVQGHVDGTASLLSRTPSENWEIFRFELHNPDLGRYLAKKGSIAVNGVSLTLADVCPAPGAGSDPAAHRVWFEVSLIPTTLADTALSSLTPGDHVNIECDVLAKYVERLAQWTQTESQPTLPQTPVEENPL